jgi:purine catabolism regulator
VAVARDFLGAGVAVLDDYLEITASAGLTESEVRLIEEAVSRARGHGPASLLGPFMETELEDVIRFPVEGTTGLVGVIVAWRPPPPDPDQLAVLNELAVACTLERARDTARMETEGKLRGELIEELLAGEAVNRESLVRRARNLGADLSRGAVAVLGRLHDPHTEGRVITDQRLIRRFLQHAQATVGLGWPLSLVEWDSGQLLCLLPPTPDELREAPSQDVEAAATTAAERLLVATRETVPGLALTLAVSRFTPDADRLGAALDEARLALSIGERLGRVGEVITFEETGTYKLLFQIFADRPDELARFYEQTLAPVVSYDEQYQTDLVGTLATYLGHDGNLAATANTLYTHRHTVRYRLDRIAELSGLDISKTDDREKLSLGLKSMRLLGKRVTERDERDLP